MQNKGSSAKVIVILLNCFVLFLVATIDIHAEVTVITLPKPAFDGEISLEKAILNRNSVREFSNDSINLKELSQLLWACQGKTRPEGYRTVPSAGALYSLEIYIFVERVIRLEPGLYHYVHETDTSGHSIELVDRELRITDLAGAALGQESISDAAVCFLITSVTDRTASEYGDRAKQYILIETGHAAQNICLQSVTLKLRAVTVGDFSDTRVSNLLKNAAEPLYLIPVGKPVG